MPIGLLTESALLGLLAGGAGLLIARISRDLLWSLRPPFVNVDALDLRMSGQVLAFTLLVSLVIGLLFGLVPALQLSRPQLADHLKDRTNRPSGFGHLFALRNVLVMAQIALSVVTLVGAGLFLRSLRNAQSTDPGFDAQQLLLISFDTGTGGYSGEAGRPSRPPRWSACERCLRWTGPCSRRRPSSAAGSPVRSSPRAWTEATAATGA